MPRAKKQLPRDIAADRIAIYVADGFESSRAAAAALGVDHTMLWRAMRGLNAGPPSAALCERLEFHSGKSMRYWRGGEG